MSQFNQREWPPFFQKMVYVTTVGDMGDKWEAWKMEDNSWLFCHRVDAGGSQPWWTHRGMNITPIWPNGHLILRYAINEAQRILDQEDEERLKNERFQRMYGDKSMKPRTIYL